MRKQQPVGTQISTSAHNNATVLADIHLAFPGLIIDSTDPRLLSCTKPYEEVRLNTNSDDFLNAQSDFETRIQRLQPDLLFKQVHFADWTMALASLCEDTMVRKLQKANHEFLNSPGYL